MSGREDLNKLFEAALNETEAPSRFGTPDSQKLAAPAVFRKASPSEDATPPFQANPPFQAVAPFQPAPARVNTAVEPSHDVGDIRSNAKPEVILDKQGVASLDSAVNAELAEIMDAKIARDKARRRRERLVAVLVLLGITGGATGWVLSNPERVGAMREAVASVKSLTDIKGMVAKYQVALDKVAVRGKQIDAASSAMGVDPTKVDEHAEGGFDKEMEALTGEASGKTTADRDKLLREKFGDVQESGSLIKKKDDAAAETKE